MHAVRAPRFARFFSFALAALLVMNVADAILTLVWIETGLALEANPLVELALRGGPVSFMAAKLAMVSGAALVLIRLRARFTQRARRLVGAGLSAALVLYASVMTFHVAHLPLLELAFI
ncbi:DUF5658 family protein [Sandaracinus amylolyticus]|uniref:DUF5658 family protein n=1 Tax=Sandaracinus amylolyticus TaxID=927083 RepID=UPI001F46629A|nr:DUF5658 family protein [Sandaracinus amylolyticus]UJR84425.1 Hypothetical protein I5071_65040 [Sandaracinus amylolyticus]